MAVLGNGNSTTVQVIPSTKVNINLFFYLLSCSSARCSIFFLLSMVLRVSRFNFPYIVPLSVFTGITLLTFPKLSISGGRSEIICNMSLYLFAGLEGFLIFLLIF